MSAITSTLSTRLVCTKPDAATSGLVTLRGQAACVRALLDELERVLPSRDGSSEDVSRQLVDELGRLASRSLEAASQLRALVDPSRRCA